MGGFFTQEIRREGERIGFFLATLDGEQGVLAHATWKSEHKIGKYFVTLEDLLDIAVPAVEEAVANRDLVIIDEIGSMECLAHKFRVTVEAALDSPKRVLATIKEADDGYTSKLKMRQDVEVLTLARDNRDQVRRTILEALGVQAAEPAVEAPSDAAVVLRTDSRVTPEVLSSVGAASSPPAAAPVAPRPPEPPKRSLLDLI